MSTREITHSANFPFPPEAVWDFITSESFWVHWWWGDDALDAVEPRWEKGARMVFQSGWTPTIEEFRRPTRLSFGGHAFELSAVGDGFTRLDWVFSRETQALDAFDPSFAAEVEVESQLQAQQASAMESFSEALEVARTDTHLNEHPVAKVSEPVTEEERPEHPNTPDRPRKIRVFISSTFRDMGAERDELLKRTFIELRRVCERRGVSWADVDLRWGITDEQKAEGKVLPICLEEIQRCRPYFIGLLGERYGWVPDEVPRDLAEREPWLAEHKERSVTELEILHGALNDPGMADHSFFYFRSPDYIDSLPSEERRDFSEAPWKEEVERLGWEEAYNRCEERKRKLVALKKRIRASGFPVREDYQDPQHLGRLVLADLMGVIDRLFPEDLPLHPLDRESAEHEAFAASRRGVYIGRGDYSDRLNQHARGDSDPLVVLGESGSGKSALLANWANGYREQHPREHVLLHFVGASRQSADWIGMLRRILGELKRHFRLDLEIPDQPDELRQAFALGLHLAAARGRMVLVLDGLNQLEDRDQAPDLVWLPPQIPANIRLILSTLPGRPLEDLARRRWTTMKVEPLTPRERQCLIEEYLSQYTKSLATEHVDQIVGEPQTENPLFLRILLEELRLYGDHFTLGKKIAEYLSAKTVVALYRRILQRYEQDYERDHPGLVREATSLLWGARRGLSEAELLDMLGTLGEPLPRAHWSPLFLAADQALVNRSGLIGFSHDYLRQAVEELYLVDEDTRGAAHLRIADYFEGRELGPRQIDELPWQLGQAGEWQRLHDLLADLPFLGALWEANPLEVKSYWARIEEKSPLRLVDAYGSVIARPSEDPSFLWILAKLLFDTGHPGPALTLREHLAEHFRETGEFSKLAAAIGGQAQVLQMRGDLDEAMALHQEAGRICQETGDSSGLARALNGLAVVLKLQGNLEGAMALHREQERIFREMGNKSGLQATLGNQGMILQELGDLDGAMALHREAERICRELGDKAGLSACLGTQAPILKLRGDLDGAMALRKEQERICRGLGDKAGLKWALGEQAVILQHQGDLDGAMTLLKENERICRELEDKGGLVVSLGNQAVIMQIRGDLDAAMELHLETERRCRELGNKAGMATALGNLAWILQVRGDEREALALHEEEERLYRELGNPRGLAISLANQAVLIAEGLHQPQRALGLAEEALDLASSHGLTAMVEQIKGIRDRVRTVD